MASPKRSLVSRCGWLLPSCPSRPSSFRATTWVDLKSTFMKMSELKDMTLTELAAKSRDFRQEIFNLRLQQASSQLEKPARLRTLRKDIARLETQMSALRKKAA